MAKDKGHRYTQEERDEFLELYRQSGYSVSRFSSEMRISYATLKRWLKPKIEPSVKLVEVESDPVSSSSASLIVRLPNGIACEIGSALSRAETVNWIRELKRC